jgi:hypothetical protein
MYVTEIDRSPAAGCDQSNMKSSLKCRVLAVMESVALRHADIDHHSLDIQHVCEARVQVAGRAPPMLCSTKRAQHQVVSIIFCDNYRSALTAVLWLPSASAVIDNCVLLPQVTYLNWHARSWLPVGAKRAATFSYCGTHGITG